METKRHFYQEGPSLANTYQSDTVLQTILQNTLPKKDLPTVTADLDRFGQRCAADLLDLANRANYLYPTHHPYTPWGERVDEIRVSHEWRQLKDVSASEGIVALGYERPIGEFSRLYQMAKLFLFHPSSAFFSCPLAMTDGAARVLEVFGRSERDKKCFEHLTSREPKSFWTSGQWMTERSGGSDVSDTSTVAQPSGDSFTLEGDKWFSSSTVSEMALGLGRIQGAPAGSRGLSLFLIETHKPDGSLNNIFVHRLKDKLGTKALPTAEIRLENTPATLVGDAGKGVKTVATMLNITRLYNSICALGHMRRILELAENYASKRVVFGKQLIDQPMMKKVFSDLHHELKGQMYLGFHVAYLMGKQECGHASDREILQLRLLTPILKFLTGKSAISCAAECMEVFGGAGYVEDTGIPLFYRDAPVFAIWEGSSNVMAHDILRIMAKYDLSDILPFAIPETVKTLLKQGPDHIETHGRDLLKLLGDAYIAYLLEHGILSSG